MVRLRFYFGDTAKVYKDVTMSAPTSLNEVITNIEVYEAG